MVRLVVGAALAGAIFTAGAWSGAAWSGQRAGAAERAVRTAEASRASEVRAAEVARLQNEVALDLQLGEVMGNANDLDGERVVFDARRMRALFPATP